jgi:hypothetical protein
MAQYAAATSECEQARRKPAMGMMLSLSCKRCSHLGGGGGGLGEGGGCGLGGGGLGGGGLG